MQKTVREGIDMPDSRQSSSGSLSAPISAEPVWVVASLDPLAIYGVSGSSDSISMYFLFTVSPKVLGKVVVGSGQNKNLLWECDHWTKVRIRRDKNS